MYEYLYESRVHCAGGAGSAGVQELLYAFHTHHGGEVALRCALKVSESSNALTLVGRAEIRASSPGIVGAVQRGFGELLASLSGGLLAVDQ